MLLHPLTGARWALSLKWITGSVSISQPMQSVCTCFPPVTLDVLCGSCHLTPCMLCTHSCPLPHSQPPCPAGSTALSSCSPCVPPVPVLCTSPAACPAAASLPRNVGEVSFLHEAFRACLGGPPSFALVSAQLFSFLSSLPSSSFLPFDVWPLLCPRVQTAHQVEMTAPTPQLGAIIRLCFSPNPCTGVARSTLLLWANDRWDMEQALVCAGEWCWWCWRWNDRRVLGWPLNMSWPAGTEQGLSCSIPNQLHSKR